MLGAGSGGREVRREWSLRSTDVGRGQGRLQLVLCCSSRDKIEGLSMGEQRERREEICRQPTWLSGQWCLAGGHVVHFW